MGFLSRPDRSSKSATESSGLTKRLRTIIENDRQQATAPVAQADTQDGMIRALDAVAIELRRMMGENARAASALGDVADEVHQILRGDIPHDL